MEAGTAQGLLQSRLRRGAAERELSLVSFLRWVLGASTLMALALYPILGSAHTLGLGLLLLGLTLYYSAQDLWLRRGGFRAGVQWLNVAVEVSLPSGLFLLDLQFQGPTYALTAPPLIFWSSLILLSSLRSNRALALFAGGLAALEYLVLYFAFSLPALGREPIVTLTPPFVLIRVFLLFASGVLTWVLAGHVLRLSERTLAQVRETDVMGKYQLGELLGVGGMAEVFRATYCPEGGFRKQVALKRLRPEHSEDAEFLALFRRESYLGSLLTHPNVVQVLDAGRFQQRYFLAMELVEGLSLAETLRLVGRPLPLAALTFVGAELAEALAYIHQRVDVDGRPLQLVHRDVNPPNVLLSRHGEVKLADFGIARPRVGRELTAVGKVRGKLRFLSPEQLRNQPLDGRADLFGLGISLYWALTGQSPFPGESQQEQIQAVLERDPLPPSRHRGEVPPALDATVLALLRREPRARVQTGQELRNRLCALADSAAPYPHGKAELAAYVAAALRARALRPAAAVPPSDPAAVDRRALISSLEPTQALAQPVAAPTDTPTVSGRRRFGQGSDPSRR